MKINSIKKALKISILMTVILALPIMYTMATENAITYTLSEDKKSAVIHLDVNKVIGSNDLVEVKDQDNNLLTEYDIRVTENGTYSYTVTYKEKVIKETVVVSEETVAENNTGEVAPTSDTQGVIETPEVPVEETIIKNEILEITVEGIELKKSEFSNEQVLQPIETVEEDEILSDTDEKYFEFDESTGTITKYLENPMIDDVIIPSTINGVIVKMIGEKAFDRTTIDSVKIPNTVISLGDYSFSNMYRIKTIDLPEGLQIIGNSAFSSCSNLISINIPNTVTSIGESAFLSCKSLVTMTIPTSVTSIGNSAFSKCESLKTIDIQAPITTIKERTFAQCYSLASFHIPNTVTNIEGWAFQDCASFVEIVIPNSVISTGESVFMRCISLEKIKLSNAMETIESSMFEDCKKLKYISIPDSVTGINYFAFRNCISLTSITLPIHCRGLGSWVFEGCKSLKEAYFPVSIEVCQFDIFVSSGIEKLIVMCDNPVEYDLPNHSALLKIDERVTMGKHIDWYRAALTGNVGIKQNVIYSVINKGKVVNLEDVFENKGTKEALYTGKKGSDLYSGNDIEIPNDYLKLPENIDTSLKYQLVGNPTSSETRIVGTKLFIGVDETSTDLKVTGSILSTTEEVPIMYTSISSIMIKNKPQDVYIEGEQYNPKGLIITVTYDNGVSEDIVYNEQTQDEFSFVYNKLSSSNNKQIIEYKGKTVEHEIKVLSKYEDPVIIPDGETITYPDGKKESFPDGGIIIPGDDKIIGTEDDTIIRPAGIDGNGNMMIPDGGAIIYPNGDKKDFPNGGIIIPGEDNKLVTKDDIVVKQGTIDDKGNIIIPEGGVVIYPDGKEEEFPNGGIILPGEDDKLGTKDDIVVKQGTIDDKGNIIIPDGGAIIYPNGDKEEFPNGGIIMSGKDNKAGTADDMIIKSGTIDDNGNIVISKGGIIIYPDGKKEEFSNGGTLYAGIDRIFGTEDDLLIRNIKEDSQPIIHSNTGNITANNESFINNVLTNDNTQILFWGFINVIGMTVAIVTAKEILRIRKKGDSD